MDFFDKFEDDIENSLRDIAGYGVHAIQPFIGNKDKIIEMFDDNLPKVFSVDIATLSPKPEFMAREHLIGKVSKPEKPRYFAMDIGYSKDSFGLAMGYIDGYKIMKREFFNDETQQLETLDEKLPICVVEMVLEIRPEKEFGEVELARVRQLIYQLKKRNYRIRRGSGDGFQSKDMEQQLKRNGIKMEYISMDKTPEPYETFRTALYDGRIRCVYNEKLEVELNDLERDYSKGGKIDHPVMSSKDLADAVGSMVYNMHIDPIYGNEDLMIGFIGGPGGNGDGESISTHNTGDKEKDDFLDWVMQDLIPKQS
jgi:hypothetical protein